MKNILISVIIFVYLFFIAIHDEQNLNCCSFLLFEKELNYLLDLHMLSPWIREEENLNLQCWVHLKYTSYAITTFLYNTFFGSDSKWGWGCNPMLSYFVLKPLSWKKIYARYNKYNILKIILSYLFLNETCSSPCIA